MRDTYIDDVLRVRRDDTARTVTTWGPDGAQTAQRAYTAGENAAADAEATTTSRETNRTILTDRAAAAIAANLASLTQAQAIQGQVSFNNTQRDDALRFLAGRVVDLTKQNNALIRLVVSTARADALDSTE